MEGSPHLLDTEILDYETSHVYDSDISNDSEIDEPQQPMTLANNGITSADRNSRQHLYIRHTSTPIDSGNGSGSGGDRKTPRSHRYAQVEFSEDDE